METCEKTANERCLLTIGHSGHSFDRFVSMLKRHNVSAVADVRSHPFSRFNPQFNRDILNRFLRDNRIYYVFLGEELGARRAEPECYFDNKARYDLIAQTSMFRSGIDRLKRGLEDHRIALLCAEKDPITCHRAVLVCRHLRSPGLSINHILEDGTLEDLATSESRLLDLVRVEERDLFGTRAQMIEHAYDVQAGKIAYVRNGSSNEAQGG